MPVKTKICTKCNQELPLSQFAKGFDKDEIDFWCTECRFKFIKDKKTLIRYCKENKRKFNEDLWNLSINRYKDKSSTEEELIKNTLAFYFSRMNFTQYKEYDDSEDEKNIKDDFDFNVSKDMIVRWGANFDAAEYMKLEDFYWKMKDANSIETPQDESYLRKLAVISIQMDKELENGSYDKAKKLGDLFSKYMADSGFRAMDKRDADKNGGIRNFGAIYAEVEKDGFIPPWEHYRKIKGISQDIVDKTIMHIENFTLRLNKFERMTEPPLDTPKLEEDEY